MTFLTKPYQFSTHCHPPSSIRKRIRPLETPAVFSPLLLPPPAKIRRKQSETMSDAEFESMIRLPTLSLQQMFEGYKTSTLHVPDPPKLERQRAVRFFTDEDRERNEAYIDLLSSPEHLFPVDAQDALQDEMDTIAKENMGSFEPPCEIFIHNYPEEENVLEST